MARANQIEYEWDIFISYCHQDHVDRVTLLKQKLNQVGISTWFDDEQMVQGYTTNLMRLGIIKSKIFVAFLIPEYNDRPNCMIELSYARQMGKTILFVFVEDGRENESQTELIKRYIDVGFIMGDSIHYKYNEFDKIKNAIESLLNKKRKPVYLLVGYTGAGKSLTGNIILNKSAKYLNSPFQSTNNLVAVPDTFVIEPNASDTNNNYDCVVIDTVGFDDKRFQPKELLNQFKEALEKVNRTIDCVIYVVTGQRVPNRIVEFIKIIQKTVLQNKFKDNSFILFTNTDENWVNANKNDSSIREILSNCNFKCTNLKLVFVDDQTLMETLEKHNQEKIDIFLKFLKNFIDNCNPVSMERIYTEEYKRIWYEEAVPAWNAIPPFYEMCMEFGNSINLMIPAPAIFHPATKIAIKKTNKTLKQMKKEDACLIQ